MSREVDRQVFRLISYGLYVIASRLDDQMNGQIVNTVFQVTAKPPRIAVSINKQNLTHEYISQSSMFSVSVLAQSTPQSFIGLFGFRSGRDLDKFTDIAHEKGIDDCPIVTEHTLAVLEAKVRDQIDVGTHTIFIADIMTARIIRDGTPLTYAFYQQVMRGKAPKTAPTYIAPVPKTAPTYITLENEKPEGS